MNRLLLILAIILIGTYKLTGQKNERYIESELSNLDKLIEKGNFIKGFVYLENDTLETELLTFRGKRKMNYYLFCVARISNDSVYVFRPSEILGYMIDNANFITHNSDGGKIFLKLIKKGRVNLYEKHSIPSDNRYLYYLLFPGIADYCIINPYENNVIEHILPDTRKSESSMATVSYFESKGIHQKFKSFISMYMGDCIIVTNMVNSEFYTINDIPSIVETYNNCIE